jgi:hypothetical protein
MATTLDLETTYAGKAAGDWVRSAFLANESLNYITFKENIDWRQVVRRLIDPVAFEAPTCDFTPLGEVTIDERWLTLKKFQVQRTLCKNDFLSTWGAGETQRGQLEQTMVDALIANMMEGIAQYNETTLWTGSGALATQYDGLMQLMGADASVITPAPAAITTATIFGVLQNIIDVMPDAVKRGNERPLLYMSQDVWEKFMFASAAAGNGWYTFGGPEVPKTYLGLYSIAVCPGMPANTIIFAKQSNLWFGTNVMSDWNNVTLVDMGQFAEDNVRFSAKFFAGTQYGIGSEIVAYSTWF